MTTQNERDDEAIRSINRPYRPNDELSKFVHKMYLELRNAPVAYAGYHWARQAAMENIAAHPGSWRVIGISEAALRLVAKNGSSDGLRRAHWHDRGGRYRRLFGVDSKEMTREELMEYFYDHDTTILVPQLENNLKTHHSTWGRIIPVPEGGYFGIGGKKAAVRKRLEMPWVIDQMAILDFEQAASSKPSFIG